MLLAGGVHLVVWGTVDSQVDGPVDITLGIPSDMLKRFGLDVPADHVLPISIGGTSDAYRVDWTRFYFRINSLGRKTFISFLMYRQAISLTSCSASMYIKHHSVALFLDSRAPQLTTMQPAVGAHYLCCADRCLHNRCCCSASSKLATLIARQRSGNDDSPADLTSAGGWAKVLLRCSCISLQFWSRRAL